MLTFEEIEECFPKTGGTTDDGSVIVSAQWLHDFARAVAAKESEACAKVKSGKPRALPQVGTGALLAEQQYCFEKGWREGAAAVRKNITKRSNAVVRGEE